MDSLTLKNQIIEQLEDLKALNITVIELVGKTDIADYMVIVTANSNRHMSALASHICDFLKSLDMIGVRPEGGRDSNWVLVDAGSVIVNVFSEEGRGFYNLEKMWQGELPAKI